MTVLITGAAGTLGRKLFQQLERHYEFRFTDIVYPEWLEQGDPRFVQADLADAEAVHRAVDGVEAVIHLGASLGHDFDSNLTASIIGTRNVFEAARAHGVRRVIYPSSNQAFGYKRLGEHFGTEITLRPTSWYGVSKAFGETVGALYADKHGIGVLVIRIGRHADIPENVRGLSLWISIEDLTQLVRIGLDHPDIHYEIVYGISDNIRGYFQNERAEQLGYRPVSRAEDYVREAYEGQAERPVDPLADRFVGGPLASSDFSGDPRLAGRPIL